MRPEQLLIDPERLHVDELEPVAFGEAAGALDLEAPVIYAGGARFGGQRRSESAIGFVLMTGQN